MHVLMQPVSLKIKNSQFCNLNTSYMLLFNGKKMEEVNILFEFQQASYNKMQIVQYADIYTI